MNSWPSSTRHITVQDSGSSSVALTMKESVEATSRFLGRGFFDRSDALKKFYDVMSLLSQNQHFTDFEFVSGEYVRAGVLKNLRIFEDPEGRRYEFSAEEIYDVLLALAPKRMLSADQKEIMYFPFSFSFSIRDVGHYRVLALATRNGLVMTVRRLSYVIPDYTTLGIPEFVKEAFLRGAGVTDDRGGLVISGGQRGGLILVTGPMGSGKTTTVASMLKFLGDHLPIVIFSVEDPIEYVFFNATGIFKQIEVNTHVDSQEEALYHALRSNAAVISLGEVRSQRELKMLLAASEYGCLTVTSFHVPDAVAALERISYELDSEVSRKVLAATLIGVLNQRLLYTEDATTGQPEFHLLCEWLPVNTLPPVYDNLIKQKFKEIRHGLQKGFWSKSGAVTMEEALQRFVHKQRQMGRDTVSLNEILKKFRYSTGPAYELYGTE